MDNLISRTRSIEHRGADTLRDVILVSRCFVRMLASARSARSPGERVRGGLDGWAEPMCQARHRTQGPGDYQRFAWPSGGINRRNADDTNWLTLLSACRWRRQHITPASWRKSSIR